MSLLSPIAARGTGGHRALGRVSALALLCGVQFMVVLDVTIASVALPAIQADLGLSEAGLQWVLSAYAIVFAGFMLLGGRVGDLLGRRRVFAAGVALFALSSLAAAFAPGGEALVAARAVQGLGAALISPAALGMLTASFPAGPERTRAVGVWASTGAFAAVAGVVLGGVFTEYASWEWIFLVNVPVGALALGAAPLLLSESRAEIAHRVDLVAGGLVTGGLMLLVTALTELGERGPAAPVPYLLLVAAAALLVAFARRERRSVEPLVPRSVLRTPQLAGANVVGFLHGAMMLGSLLLLTVSMQSVLGLSPLQTGLGLLAVRITSVACAKAVARAIERVGVGPVVVAGMAGMTVALGWLARVPADGAYAVDLLPALLVLGVAIPCLFVGVDLAALACVPARDAGLASGLVSTSKWVGGALGLAVVSTLLAAGGDGALGDPGAAAREALAGGVQAGFAACAAVGVVGLVVALRLARRGLSASCPVPVVEGGVR